MPITADQNGKNYTLPKGRVFFDRYPQNVTITASTVGEGERYFGNTPEFSTTQSTESLDHFDSDAGIRVKDDSVQLSNDRTGSFTTDNINAENLALAFLGTVGSVVQTAQTAQNWTVTAKRGRQYQVGTSPSNPTGVRKISNVTVKKGSGFATTVTMAGNYEVDADLGRIYIEVDSADIPDGTEIQVTYDVAASTRKQIISGSNAIYGALRFISENPKGEKNDYYFPYVKLSPDGDIALKGDDWQSITFSFEILKKGTLEALYIDGRATTG